MKKPEIDKVISAAQRRVFCQQWLAVLGPMLLLGCGIAAVLVLADRLLAVVAPWWLYAVAVAAAAVAAPGVAWWRRPDRTTLAARIDQRLGLKDRLGSALFASSIADHPFAHHVIVDAQHNLTALPLAKAFPLRLTRAWGYLPLCLAAVAALAWWTPPLDIAGLDRQLALEKAQLAHAAATKQQIEKIEKTVAQIKHVQVGQLNRPPREPKLPDGLSGVTPDDLTAPGVKQETAIKLSRLQDQLAEHDEQNRELLDALQDVLSQLKSIPDGPASELTESLKRADFPAAARASEDLIRSIEAMSDQDRQALAQQLDELSQQLQRDPGGLAERDPEPLSVDPPPPHEPLPHHPTERTDQPSVDAEAKPQRNQPPTDPTEQQRTANGQQQQRPAQQPPEAQPASPSEQVCQELSDDLGQSGKAVGDRSQPGAADKETAERSLKKVNRLLDQLAELQRQRQHTRQAQRQTQDTIDHLYQPANGAGSEPAQPIARSSAESDRPLGSLPVRLKPGANTGDSSSMTPSMTQGPNAGGQSAEPFNPSATTAAAQRAQQAVTDNRVPRRYHETVRDYFKRLPAPAEPGPGADPSER